MSSARALRIERLVMQVLAGYSHAAAVPLGTAIDLWQELSDQQKLDAVIEAFELLTDEGIAFVVTR